MDQKKTLWIIAAVGAFLLFVLGAAFIMYPKAPKVAQTITTNTLTESKNLSTSSKIEQEDDGWIKENVEIPNDFTVKDLTVFSENANVYGFDTVKNEDGETLDLNSVKNQIENSNENSNQKTNQITVVIKDETSKNIVAENNVSSNNEYVEKTPEKTVKTETSVKPKNVIKNNESTSNVKKVTSTTNKEKSKIVEKLVSTKTQFWVQVGSYSNKKTAESARSSLDENKISSDIFTYEDSKGKLFYRVRVGPYTTKSEAEYWRSKIIKIDAFSKAESYITSTQTEL